MVHAFADYRLNTIKCTCDYLSLNLYRALLSRLKQLATILHHLFKVYKIVPVNKLSQNEKRVFDDFHPELLKVTKDDIGENTDYHLDGIRSDTIFDIGARHLFLWGHWDISFNKLYMEGFHHQNDKLDMLHFVIIWGIRMLQETN